MSKEDKMSTTIPTIEEIINLYLWGSKEAPSPEEITDDKYIRDAKNEDGTPYTILTYAVKSRYFHLGDFHYVA